MITRDRLSVIMSSVQAQSAPKTLSVHRCCGDPDMECAVFILISMASAKFLHEVKAFICKQGNEKPARKCSFPGYPKSCDLGKKSGSNINCQITVQAIKGDAAYLNLLLLCLLARLRLSRQR